MTKGREPAQKSKGKGNALRDIVLGANLILVGSGLVNLVYGQEKKPETAGAAESTSIEYLEKRLEDAEAIGTKAYSAKPMELDAMLGAGLFYSKDGGQCYTKTSFSGLSPEADINIKIKLRKAISSYFRGLVKADYFNGNMTFASDGSEVVIASLNGGLNTKTSGIVGLVYDFNKDGEKTAEVYAGLGSRNDNQNVDVIIPEFANVTHQENYGETVAELGGRLKNVSAVLRCSRGSGQTSDNWAAGENKDKSENYLEIKYTDPEDLSVKVIIEEKIYGNVDNDKSYLEFSKSFSKGLEVYGGLSIGNIKGDNYCNPNTRFDAGVRYSLNKTLKPDLKKFYKSVKRKLLGKQ